jgi:molybdate transport system substrate-binding protein
MLRLLKLLVGLLAPLLALGFPASSQTVAEVTVFAATSLTKALQEVADNYTRQGGTNVRFSFAASSALAKQIEAGAGAQIFISADDEWMRYLGRGNFLARGTRRSLLGDRLVLVVPPGRPRNLDLSSGRAWLDQLPAGRIVTGDPADVPVDRYIQQALTRLGAWADVEPRLARAGNAGNALGLVERGEAAAGIVYGTDAVISKQVAIAGTFPETSHDPVIYWVVLLRGGLDQREARKFYDYLATPEVLATFAKHGFTVDHGLAQSR